MILTEEDPFMKRSQKAHHLTIVTEGKPAPAPKRPAKRVAQTPPPSGGLPPLSKAQRDAQARCQLRMDEQGRTAIVVGEADKGLRYLPMDPAGIYVYHADRAQLDRLYKHSAKDPASPMSLQGTDVSHAARSYVTHMKYAGGSEEALEELAKLVPITPQERETIMAKSAAASAPRVAGAGVTAAKPRTGGGSKKRTGAAATFRELIMKGGLTDEQIFEEVRKRHPEVTPDKRGYVAWYRNDLKKKGQNPPGPKGGAAPKADAKGAKKVDAKGAKAAKAPAKKGGAKR